MHAPVTHVWFVQADPLVQVPFVLQLCGVLPLHCCWPVAHTPVQAPATQVWLVQAAGVPHCPFAPHVATPVPEHCV